MPMLLQDMEGNNYRALARTLTMVENDLDGAFELLAGIDADCVCPVIGITGPPGAGKSTLVSALLSHFLSYNKKVAILAVDPTSPFTRGSLLGDRIRMAEHFNNQQVYIRSLAARGALGGLSEKTIEMSDVLRAAGFDLVIIETVGVGQSEIEIAALADTTVVVLVPESGDEIQHAKSGLMEVADVFVVNKADREGADIFANNLKKLVQQKSKKIPVFITAAHKKEGVSELADYLLNSAPVNNNERKLALLAEKAYKLIRDKRMSGISKEQLHAEISEAVLGKEFNLYRFVDKKLRSL